MRTAVNRRRMFFPLGEARRLNYNPVAKCRQKSGIPPVVSEAYALGELERSKRYLQACTTALKCPGVSGATKEDFRSM